MGFVKGEEKEFEPFHECEEQEKLNSDDKCDPKRVRQQEIDQQNFAGESNSRGPSLKEIGDQKHNRQKVQVNQRERKYPPNLLPGLAKDFNDSVEQSLADIVVDCSERSENGQNESERPRHSVYRRASRL